MVQCNNYAQLEMRLKKEKSRKNTANVAVTRLGITCFRLIFWLSMMAMASSIVALSLRLFDDTTLVCEVLSLVSVGAWMQVEAHYRNFS